MKYTTTLYLVTITLSRDLVRIRVENVQANVTDKSYLYHDRRVSKDKIMKVDTIFIENHKNFSYYTYCLVDDVQNAIDKIKLHIKENIEKVKQEFEDTYNSFTKLNTVEIEYRDGDKT